MGKSVNDLTDSLDNLIEKHRLWVSTSGQQGLQLDVSDVDMRELETLKMQKLTALRGKNVKFFGMNLYKVELQSTQLEKADFRRCDMEEADVRGSNLEGARFHHANLKGANFSSLLIGAGSRQKFAPCILDGASFRYADLSEANLRNASLIGADLSYCNLEGADLSGADLSNAKMDMTRLDGAMMKDAKTEKTQQGRAFSITRLKESNDDD